MKTVIRKGVFETNSSSTHSLSYSPREDEDGKEGFTFACKTPAARLLMIKAQVNHCLEDLRYEGKSQKYIALVRRFYDVCVDLFCRREQVDPSTIGDYLADFARKTFYGGTRAPEANEWDPFRSQYDDMSCELCESFFEDGPLQSCSCLYWEGDVKPFLREFFDMEHGKPDLEAKAEELLYGPNSFYCCEYYSGVYLIDNQNVY